MKYYQIFRKLYQWAAKKMCQECQAFIENGSKILDLGCGSGIIGKEFQDYFRAKLIGIDIKDRRVEKIPFQIFDGFNIPFPENYFDVVLINYVLHHVNDPIALLKEAKRVSKEKIIIYEDLPEGFLSKLNCKFHQLSYNLFFGNSGEKLNFKTKKEWEEFFKKSGLKLIAQKRTFTDFDFFDPVKRVIFILEK